MEELVLLTIKGLVSLAIIGGLAFIIAHFLGRKRQIGFDWSLFLCIFLTPIIGFIVVMLSRKYYDDNPKPSRGKKVWGWILIVLGALAFWGSIQQDFTDIFIPVGLIGLGYYLIELGKGKTFNTKALTKSDK